MRMCHGTDFVANSLACALSSLHPGLSTVRFWNKGLCPQPELNHETGTLARAGLWIWWSSGVRQSAKQAGQPTLEAPGIQMSSPHTNLALAPGLPALECG